VLAHILAWQRTVLYSSITGSCKHKKNVRFESCVLERIRQLRSTYTQFSIRVVYSTLMEPGRCPPETFSSSPQKPIYVRFCQPTGRCVHLTSSSAIIWLLTQFILSVVQMISLCCLQASDDFFLLTCRLHHSSASHGTRIVVALIRWRLILWSSGLRHSVIW
jgi:hypothetical protein